MGMRSGSWAAEAAFRFQVRHQPGCLKFNPHPHLSVRYLDGPIDASYDVLNIQPSEDYVYTESSRSPFAGSASANRARTRKTQTRDQGVDRRDIDSDDSTEAEVQ